MIGARVCESQAAGPGSSENPAVFRRELSASGETDRCFDVMFKPIGNERLPGCVGIWVLREGGKGWRSIAVEMPERRGTITEL